MNTKDSYNQWSDSYDTDYNLTRDLDRTVTKEKLGGMHFDSILEIGCGTGKNTSFLSTIGYKVNAVDFSEGMINIAKKKSTADNVKFSMLDITNNWPFTDESYDLIVCNLVLEHIDDIFWIFSEAGRSLKKEGKFFICELHPFKQYLGTKAKYTVDTGQMEIPSYVHHLSDFTEAGRKNKLSIEEINEWRHKNDEGNVPRLLSILFEKRLV